MNASSGPSSVAAVPAAPPDVLPLVPPWPCRLTVVAAAAVIVRVRDELALPPDPAVPSEAEPPLPP